MKVKLLTHGDPLRRDVLQRIRGGKGSAVEAGMQLNWEPGDLI